MQKLKSGGAAVPYAWFILVILFVGLVASFGMRASFGAYIIPWEEEFSASKSLVSGVPLLGFAVFAVSQPFIGKLNDRLGKNIVPFVCLILLVTGSFLTSRATHLWQIFILNGVIFNIGVSGLSNVIVGAIITNWFVEKRGLALGLAMSGMAVGQMTMYPTNLIMIERLEWRPTLAMLSIIILVVVGPLFLVFLRCKPHEKGLKPYGYVESGESIKESEKPVSLPILSIFKQRAFWLLSIPFFICGFTDVGLINGHLPAIAISDGKDFAQTVTTAFVLIGVANIGGTIVTGYLSDRFSRKRQLAVIYIVRLFTFVLLISLQRPALLLVFALIYGAVEMASIAPVQSLTVQMFEGYSVGTILGVVSISHQLGGSVGSWVPGLLYDITGSYHVMIILSMIMLVGAAALSLGISEPGVK